MPRPLLIRSETHPYHVTSRCNNKEFFSIPLMNVWDIMIYHLRQEVEDHKLAIHAFVLMSNHFHLLCHTPKGNLDQIMHRFLRSTSMHINSKRNSINHLWGGRYKWSLIESQNHYYQVYRYVYQNPVRAGLCKKVEDYPYSTLKTQTLPLHSFIPMAFGGNEGELHWLNRPFEDKYNQLIKMGLKKYKFSVSKRKELIFERFCKLEEK